MRKGRKEEGQSHCVVGRESKCVSVAVLIGAGAAAISSPVLYDGDTPAIALFGLTFINKLLVPGV